MIDADPVRIMLILERQGKAPLATWTPLMERYKAHGCLRDWASSEWYDGSPVGWDPCDNPSCSDPDHVLRVMRALILDQAS